jgi:hypothetical protein
MKDQSMRCRCGFENAVVAKFCGNCGAELDLSAKARRWPIVAVAGVAASLLVGFAAYRYSGGVVRLGSFPVGTTQKTGIFAINPQFADAAPFSDGVALVLTDAGRIGYIDKTGTMVIPDQFESEPVSAALLKNFAGQTYPFRGRGFSEGLASVRVAGSTGGKHGYIDKTGEMVISPQFDYAADFSEGLAVVGIGEQESTRRYGYIDKTGAFVVNPQYGFAYEFSEGLAEVQVNNKFGYIDRTGKMVVPPLSAIGGPRFSEGLVGMSIGGRQGYFDRSGQVAITPQFAWTPEFSEGLAAVIVEFNTNPATVSQDAGKKWGYIDRTGRMVIPQQFDGAGEFAAGLAVVWVGDRAGYVDKTGKLVINPQFDHAEAFAEGLAAVRVGDAQTGKYGFIDRNGEMVVSPQFDYAGSFAEGLARVRIGDAATGKWGYIWR